ncbi:TetR family transcriptional regulator [Arcicella aurantiaca]|uniref:TetR family transcriptional regulator n=1 Tax=Arcicella aurantiaca TaxID=591202 RepID=A0A316DU46_9BACT|nr:TetR/AcrR family transcriptional regulator [Arcicella aurantiaca]PWK20093.1 TetR family transcriptional regulator [Arcicella aurantiaca]
MARTKVFDEEEVLDKAMNLFWLKGYNATSAQDLVEGLGISRSSLYDTYGDKHSLFVRTLKKYRRERIDNVIAEATVAEDVEVYIRKAFEVVKNESLQENYARGCFMVNSAVELAPFDDEVAAIANSIMVDIEEAICTAIQRGQDKGIFTMQHSARALARFIMNSFNGLRVTIKIDSGKKVFDDIVNICLSTLKR